MTTQSGPPDKTAAGTDLKQDVERLRALIAQGKHSQRAAARELGVDERTMRYWCTGDYPAPPMAFRALDPRVRHYENLKHTIAGNERQIALFESGQMTQGYGPALGSAESAMAAAKDLRRKNEELRALARQEEAFHHRQLAFFDLHQQLLPHGDGQPTLESIARFDAADKAWREAQAEVERIVKEIRSGLR